MGSGGAHLAINVELVLAEETHNCWQKEEDWEEERYDPDGREGERERGHGEESWEVSARKFEW